MKTIVLNTLAIRNFKGCRELTLNLNGRSAAIYGDNAAGKTTIYDALTWLLFGKDSSGAAKFNIKPLNESGEVIDHSAQTSVRAELLVDGQPMTLERTYFEVWTKKRGRGEVFDGHSSGFLFNDLSVNKGEFLSRVAEICDEATFRTLTDLRWFCQGESESNRRAALFRLIGGVTEEDVLNTDKAFEPLSAALMGLSVAEYKRSATERRRRLNTACKNLPARMDECRRSVGEYEGMDFDALRTQREEKAAQAEEARIALDALRSSTDTSSISQQAAGYKAQLEALEQRNALHRAGQRDEEKRLSLAKELSSLTASEGWMKQEIGSMEAEIPRLEGLIVQCRTDWKAANAMTFTPGVCPHCGQMLPASQVERHRADFLAERSRRMSEAQSAAGLHKARQQELAKRLEEQRQALDANTARQAELRPKLEAMNRQVVTDLPEYAREKARLTHEVVELENRLGALRQGAQEASADARRRFITLSDEVKELDSALACELVLNNSRKRLTELEQERKKTETDLEQLDALLELCERFTAAMSDYISGKVNGMFSMVRWKLFEEQVNGGLKDCCVAAVEGVPYNDLNTGAQINAGLDVIATLSDAYGIRVPLFVDNAESVTHLVDTGTQVIRLVVSGGDRQLRVEEC